MSLDSSDEAVDREIGFYQMPVELFVSPAQAREYVGRLFQLPTEDVSQTLHQLYSQGDWGSHIDRAVLSVAIEAEVEVKYELIERITDEMITQPQLLAETAGISMSDGALARARMALFDARCNANTDNPTLEQFLSHW